MCSRKAPTPPPTHLFNSSRPTIPVIPSKVSKVEYLEEGRMDYQIEFTYYNGNDKLSLDPRDILYINSFGGKAVINHHGKETMVNEDYYDCCERLREAIVTIQKDRRLGVRSDKWRF